MSLEGDRPEDVARRWKTFRRKAMGIAGTEAKNHFKENFRKQGFDTGTGVQRWKPRSESADRNEGRGILIDSGLLRRSIRIMHKEQNRVVVGTSIPYARAHNFGLKKRRRMTIKSHLRRSGSGTVRVRSHSRNGRINISQRQFIGNSPGLRRRINKAFVRELEKVL